MAEPDTIQHVFLRVLHLTRQIETILSDEGEQNWIRGVRGVIGDMEQTPSNDADRIETLKSVTSAYQVMLFTRDALGDFVVRRDTHRAYAQANRELDSLRDEVWELLFKLRTEGYSFRP